MNKRIRLHVAALLVFAGFIGQAAAQRPTVPVVDFKDIPVSLATAKPLTVDQVRQAIMAAAQADRWEATPAGDGVLQLKLLKNGKHTVVLKMPYGAEKYSAIFESAENMNYSAGTMDRGTVAQSEAKRKQRELMEARPDFRFSAPRAGTLIHPYYEVWVHELLSSVRRQLQAVQ